MFYSNALASSAFALLLASRAISAQRQQAPTDVQILNYALTLEHLENAFYSEALAKYDEKSFSAAGLNRSLFQEISGHESDHVDFLSKALGDQATKPCNYSFPYNDIKSFAAFSMLIEGVGVSAYLGAAGYITNKDYLTAAGSILTTESRHAAYVSSVSTNHQAPWSTAFDTPLDLNQVYSLAAPCITSCPSSNPPLPVKSFPAFNLTTINYTAGSNLTIAVSENATSTAHNNTQLYVAFLTGLRAIYTPYDSATHTVVLPQNFTDIGTVYAVLTSKNATDGSFPTDDNTLAGPAVLRFSKNITEEAVNGTGTRKSGTASNGAADSKAGFVLNLTALIVFLVVGFVAATL